MKQIFSILAILFFAVQLHSQTFPIKSLSISYKLADGTYVKSNKDSIVSGTIQITFKKNKETLQFSGKFFEYLGLSGHDFVLEKSVMESNTQKKYYKCGKNMVIWSPKNYRFSFWNGKINNEGTKKFNHYSYDTYVQ